MTKKMNLFKVLLSFLCTCIFITFFSCGNSHNKKGDQDRSDSLALINLQQKQTLYNLNSTLEDVSASLDVIAQQENVLLSNRDENGKILSKEKILSNLNFFEKLLVQKEMKMKELQDSLMKKNGSLGKLSKIIKFLNSELQGKNKMICSLKKEIQSKDFNIKSLNEKVTLLNQDVSNLQTESETQKVQIETKENELNEVYYIIGTKSMLTNKGVLQSINRPIFSDTQLS